MTVVQTEGSGSLEIRPDQTWWTSAQLAALDSIGLGACPDAHRMAFLHQCQSSGLNPWERDAYYIGRKAWNNDLKEYEIRWTFQCGIDGFRKIAERSGLYGGRIGPLWCGKDGQWQDVWISDEPPVAAKVGVRRTDHTEPTYAVALYSEYVPLVDEYEGTGNSRKKTGRKVASGLWPKMPAVMLAKVAEAAAIRAAFPRNAGGAYVHEELHRADLESKEAAESERDRQRRELTQRPWDRGGVVLDGQAVTEEVAFVPPVDRRALLAELAEQAKAADKTILQWTTRWQASHKKALEKATDAELEQLVASRRTGVTEPEPDAPLPSDVIDGAVTEATEPVPAEVPVAADPEALFDPDEPEIDPDTGEILDPALRKNPPLA